MAKIKCNCASCVSRREAQRRYLENHPVIRKKYGMRLLTLPVTKDRPEKFSVKGDGCPCKRCEGFRKRNERKRQYDNSRMVDTGHTDNSTDTRVVLCAERGIN